MIRLPFEMHGLLRVFSGKNTASNTDSPCASIPEKEFQAGTECVRFFSVHGEETSGSAVDQCDRVIVDNSFHG